MDDLNFDWPSNEFEGQEFYENIFQDINLDLEKLFPGETRIPDFATINRLPHFTRNAVILLRESIIRNCSITEAAEGMGMDLTNWDHWTVTYATDFFMQLNNPVIYL